MKDKRTYKYKKEHGEDMSHENETKIDAVTVLTEQYKADLHAYKEREGLVKALGPLHKKTSSVFLYRGSRIKELAACGLKLEACCLGLDACRLMLEQVGSKA
jgi:hypothetical protein